MSEKHEVEEHLLKPLWIATQISDHPCIVYWIVFVLMIILCIIDAQVFELNLTGDSRTYLVEDDKYTVNFDAWTLALEKNDYLDDDDENSTTLPQTEQAILWTVFMMFELKNFDSSTNNWILTPENIEIILEYEDKVFKNSYYKNYFCYVGDNPISTSYQCQYYSVARMVDDYFTSSDTSEDYTTENIINYVWKLRESSPGQAVLVESSFDPSFSQDNTTRYYRGFYYTGGPVPDTIENITTTNGNMTYTYVSKTSKYSDLEDDYDAQEDEFNKEFGEEIWIDITVDNESDLREGDLRIAIYMLAIWIDYIITEFFSSIPFIVLAMVAVGAWMTVHLQSCFLSCFALCGIMFSFPFAYFIYYFIYGISHFDFLSALVIFVLLGIGADDVFVFTGMLI